MSPETDHMRQRSVAEILAEHRDAGAGMRGRRRGPAARPFVPPAGAGPASATGLGHPPAAPGRARPAPRAAGPDPRTAGTVNDFPAGPESPTLRGAVPARPP
ncbi:MAG: hypothetical protein K0R87_3066, partial [Pseudonocardia sp.]|nr:hypothetical protein [Pseudonocardia sp.]